MVLKQIKCPPRGTNKRTIGKFMNTWIPAMEKYAFDYIGIGDIIGTTSNKDAKETAIGDNKFVQISGKCGKSSDSECVDQDRYMYLKSYPLGYLPTCRKKGSKDFEYGEKLPIMGKTGLIGNIQEDMYHLGVGDFTSSLVGGGPLSSVDCMKARLPVGNGLLLSNKKVDSKEDSQGKRQAWWIEEKCIPRLPTTTKKYGNETFEIPFSSSLCIVGLAYLAYLAKST